MKKLISLLLLGFGLSSLTACNTLRGMGQDVERAGEEIDEEL